MGNWRNRPKFIEMWPSSISHVMFIDESGNSNLRDIQRKLVTNTAISNFDRYFTVTGCIVSRDDFSSITEDIIELKNKYWTDGKFSYGNGSKTKLKRVCFHSKEIRGRSGPFSPDVIDYEAFTNDLSVFIQNLPITIFSSTINKVDHCSLYINPFHPYDLCMDFVLERFVKYYLSSSSHGVIMLEARGNHEDKQVLNHIKNVIDNGTFFISKDYFRKIGGVYFNPKWCKQSDEQTSYLGLEIADLCCYPIHKYCRSGNKDKAYETIENKIHNYPNIEGAGIKVFPKK